MHRHPLLDNKNRLVAEVRTMQQKYANRAVLRQWDDELGWEYAVRESGREYPIKILYPKNFPASAPRIVSVNRLPSSPHQLGGGELCWVNHWTWQSDWNPSRDTAAVCIPAAHRWFACLLIYLSKGKWPDGAND
jgi:ubiquitin-protein ligase